MALTKRPKGIIDGLRVTDLTSLPNSVANSDGTLTISPTTGTVVASLALGNANTWTSTQTFQDIGLALSNTYDIGSLTTPARTIFLDDDGSFGIEFPTAIGTGAATDYGIFCGGGSANASGSDGGKFTFGFDATGTSVGDGVNSLVFDMGSGGHGTTVGSVEWTLNQGATRGLNKLALTLNQTGASFTSSLSGTGTENLQFTASDGDVVFKSNANAILFSWAAGLTMDINSTQVGNFGKWRADTHAFLQSWVASGFGGEGYVIFGKQFSNAGFVQVKPPALTCANNTSYSHLDIAPGGTVTMAGTVPLCGSLNIEEPNITGTPTDAFTLRIGGAPTEGGTSNQALWVDGGVSRLDGDIDISTIGNRIILDTDGDTSIRTSADDLMEIELGGTDRILLDENSGAPLYKFQSNQAGTALGPQFWLYRNKTGTTGDNLAQLLFVGQSDNSTGRVYGSITSVATTASDGSEDGSLVFQTITGGTVATTQLELGPGTAGLFGATPVNQASGMTAQLTTLSGDITPGTPDYVMNATSGGFGNATSDEFETMTSVIANLQVRVAELEAGLDATTGIGVFA